MHKKTLLIDLDGVLNNYSGEYDENYIPDIKFGAKKFLEKLNQLNFDVKIFTTRNLLLASKWLIHNEIDNLVSDITNVKSPAYLYIDGRCLLFNGDYDKTINLIEEFKVYWKN